MTQPTLVQEFIEAIKNSAAKLTTYQESCNKFTDDTRAHAEELSKLIDRLAACIKEIEALQKSCNHRKKSVKLVRKHLDSASPIIRYVCDECYKIIGYPSSKDIDNYLKQ